MEIWMVCVEIIVPPENVEMIPPIEHDRPKSEIGFMNITTWADSQEMAEARIQKCLEYYGWHLVSIENSHIVSEDRQYGEPELSQIERTRSNPNFTILGTFHTYRTN